MRTIIGTTILVAGTIGLAACGSSSSGTATSSSGGPAKNTATASAGPKISTAKGVLVDSSGMTLYSLSVEKQGHIICTGACLKIWHPVSGKPTGSIASLASITRSDGTVQAAYKGRPLYTFAQDTMAGDMMGEGIKDVGTWHAARASGAAKPAASVPSTSSSSGGYSGY
jgi:predicted lipoprotein with Yx(FWY)xxD motif